MTDTFRLPVPLKVARAAELASVSEDTLRSQIRLGHLRAVRIGRCLRVLDEDLAAWLRLRDGENEAGGTLPGPRSARPSLRKEAS
jgi:excisionase family DNA binding protein